MLALLGAAAHAQVVTTTLSGISIDADADVTAPNNNPVMQYFAFNTTTGVLSGTVDRPPHSAVRFAVVDQTSMGTRAAFIGSWNGGYEMTSTNLITGTSVSSSLTWGTNQFTFSSSDASLSSVYRGIRVSDGAGGYYYGYINFSTGATFGSFGPTTMTFNFGALETSLNTAITASAIPEPSTYAALAGLAAFGLVAWRRRKAAA
ncbi:MAG: PEP-CTERM sorting domain-containing protein [Verrucomicrobiota bacterium]